MIDIVNIIDKVLNERSDYLESLVKERLREKGTDYDGKGLRTYAAIEQNEGLAYSIYTTAVKQNDGKTFKHVTLEEHGDFYRTFRARSKKAILSVVAAFDKGVDSISDNLDTSKVMGWDDFDTEQIQTKLLYPKVIENVDKQLENEILQSF